VKRRITSRAISSASAWSILADDLRPAAAEEVSPLAPDRQNLDRLTLVLAHEGRRGLRQIRVEGPGQPLVGRDEHEQVARVAARVHQRVPEVLARLRGQVCQHLRHLHGEGARRDRALLRTLQLRRRDHLHGLRDLLRILDRLDAPADVEEVCHRTVDGSQ
jgi:hypothetical protein